MASVAACIALPAVTHAPDATSLVATTLQQSRDALGATALRRGGVLLIESTAIVSGLNGTGSSAAEIGAARLAERTSTPPIATGDGYDGTAFWNQDQSGLVWTDGSDAGVSQEIDTAYAAGDTLFVPGSGGATVAWDGVRAAGGRQYATLIVTPRHSLLPMQVWIDAASHLPARYVVTVGPVRYESDVSDYRPVDGLLVPHRAVSKSSEGNSSDLTVTSARIVTNDEAAFVKPKSQVDDFSINGTRTSTSVPIDVIDNHVYLDVTLDGKGPYRFVFDTGGSNIIDPAVAKDINAVGSGSAQDSGTGAGTESSSYATVDSLKIGNAVLRHQVFLVEPIREGFGATAGERVDGLIGFEVLARYITTFDYVDRTLTLAMPGILPAAGADVVHFVLLGTNPQVGCAIDSVPSECTVDTGDGGSVNLFVPFIAAHPQIVPATHSAVGVNGSGVGGGHRGFMGRLRSLQIGSFALHDLVAGYSTQKQGFFASPFLAANVGGGVWKRFTVTFDYRAETMALLPNAGLGKRDSYDRSGMHLINDAGKIVVYDVRQGTPAAKAGLAKGDMILSIDGVAQRSLEQVRHALREAPGTVLRLQVVDKTGTPRTMTLTLRDWV
ncbi:MAG: aspartyl protease family protein [Candidatus Cybelea sp.]